MSGNPTNVVPMPTNWPGPMFTPKTWPSSPSCFSELAGLNACYDSVQMMEQILAKVMTDLVTNNVAVQTAIVEAIAKSGSNVPLIGVTNGSDAQPGQVGEYLETVQVVNYTAAAQTQIVTGATLQPGDWDCTAAMCFFSAGLTNVYFQLTQAQPGVNNLLQGGFALASSPAGDLEAASTVGVTGRALITAPTLFAFTVGTNTMGAGGGAGACQFIFWARRRR